MLDAASVHNHSGSCASIKQSNLHNFFRRDAGNLRSDIGRVFFDGGFCRFPIVGAVADKIFVNQIFFDDNIKHSVCGGNVSSGLQLQMQIALSGCRRFARVDDNPAPAVIALFL
jgi:hypothetical protein